MQLETLKNSLIRRYALVLIQLETVIYLEPEKQRNKM